MILADDLLAGLSFEDGWEVREMNGGTFGENTVQIISRALEDDMRWVIENKVKG